ncbi:MAG TPA: metal ABC transporter substrate-binding protein, partial [Dehalococcoidia bacterium]|nr:metal ABC transporter substrate-binding protein [Dehalococcoidia bacterium]
MIRHAAILIALGACLSLALSACGGDDNGNAGAPKLKVVTSVSPITSIVENVGGTAIDLQGVIPENVNSHTFQPPPSTAAAFKDADLIVFNGLKLEEPLLAMAKANQKGDAVILLLGDQAITQDQYKYGSSFPQSAGNPNPHLWTDPDLTKEYATLVHDQLVKMDERNKDYYDTN